MSKKINEILEAIAKEKCSIYFYVFNRIEKRKIKLLDTFLNESLGTEDCGPR
jgi:hypothetical protein